MSRLFSQLENIGHDRTDVEKPAPDQGAATAGVPPASTQAGPQDLSAAPPPLTEAPTRPNYSPASTLQPQIPGYAIASQLALSSGPRPPVTPSRATWPVRLWFLSLLALIGISLAMLLSPRDDTASVQRPAPGPAAMAPELKEDDEPLQPPGVPASPAASSSSVKAEAGIEKKSVPAAAPVASPAEKPVARRQPSRPPADQPATAPRPPAGDAGCSAAMAAMNLCSASHP
jgi:hypothetical protein